MKIVSQCALAGALFSFAHACTTAVELKGCPPSLADADCDILLASESDFLNEGGSQNGGSGGLPGTGGTPGRAGAPGGGGTPGTGGNPPVGGAPSGGGQPGAGAGGVTAGGAGGAGGAGTAGAAGAAQGGTGGSDVIVPTGTCVEAGEAAPIALTVAYTELNDTNQIGMRLRVTNTGTSYAMSALVIRYWFTAGALTGFVRDVDFVTPPLVAADIVVTYGEALGSNYADINVNRADAIGTGIDAIQIRIHTPGFGTMNHTDDFSFVDAANVAINESITAYVSGEQVFGCEPPIP